MKIIFKSDSERKSPRITFILIDWSVRESFHTIDYLNNQNISRDTYEVIWIEYHNRRLPQIESKIRDYKRVGKNPPIDKWVTVGIPESVQYHKHLMYNIGIMLSTAEIVVIMDSDAVVGPSFIGYILQAFRQNTKVVLHLDEVRNNSRRFYPFNYPSVEEILGEGCINWKDGKTTGLYDESDTFHSRNYGCCMAALRSDLIRIGGADEHMDFLGRMCGPYDMTFRLRNFGLKEIWGHDEFLYHVWHPGLTEDVYVDYIGPNDSNNMSTTALDTLRSGRILPLVENNLIARMRGDISAAIDITKMVNKNYVISWNKENNNVKTCIKVVKSAAIIENGYRGFNIISWQGRFYAISQELGKIDFSRLNEEKLRVYLENKKCFTGNSLGEVKHLVSQVPAYELPPRLIESDYNGFNIVLHKNKYYAISQDLGPVDLLMVETNAILEYQDKKKCFIGNHLEEVKYQIAQFFCENSKKETPDLEKTKG